MGNITKVQRKILNLGR